uniref:CapA family protein n=1 Tax=uncultured Allobacillus sp. TaxID=1638025 RepID=UPI0025935300|nr:CapA family protein [uncultured Allobacillus sp.]
MNDSRKFTLGATGDILLHKRVYKHAKKADEEFNFAPQLENVRDLFDEVDLSIVNQESLIAGDALGLSDFPRFNSPSEISHTLKDMGVDIVSIANNHTLDFGEKGIFESIKKWEEIRMPYVGAYKSNEDFNTLRVFHKNGLRIGFLSLTKLMGKMKIPKEKKWIIDHFEGANIIGASKKIRKIRSLDVIDVLIVSVHFGEEYHFRPTSIQEEISRSLSDAGADVILGHHPHVLQPVEILYDSRGWDTFVAYSLGNFFTGQKGLFRQIGGFLNIEIEKPIGDNPVHFSNSKFTLTFCDMFDGYKMHKLKDYIEENHIIKTHKGEFNGKDAYEKMVTLLQSRLPNFNVQ